MGMSMGGGQDSVNNLALPIDNILFRLLQSIGSCVRFNGPHNTGESRQFVHITLEKLSHFT